MTVADGPRVTFEKEVLGRGMRRKEVSVKLRDYICNTTIKSSITSQQTGLEYGIENFVNYDRFSKSHRAFFVSITEGVIPNTFVEAIKYPRWRETMRLEIAA